MENRSATRRQLLRRWSSGTPNPRCTQRMRHRFAVRSSWRTILTRCWARVCVLRSSRPCSTKTPTWPCAVLMTGMPDGDYRNLRRLGRIFPAYYRFRHKIKAQRLQQDRADVADALDRISRELQPSGYLVGEAFSVADLTAAAMLGALLQPAELQYPLAVVLPDSLQQYRDDLARHPAALWTLEIYRRHRGRSAEVRRDKLLRPANPV